MIDHLLTIREAAARLGLSPERITQLGKTRRPDGAIWLPNRPATSAEATALLTAGRIRAITHTGVKVIAAADLAGLPDRGKPGHPVTTGAGLRRKDRRKAEPTESQDE